MEDLKSIIAKIKANKITFSILFIGKTLFKIIAVLFIFNPNNGLSETVNAVIRKGNKVYQKSKYSEATEKYSSALEKEPNNAIANFNQADAVYQLGEYKQAAEHFKAIATSSKNSEIKFKSNYNLGNSYYKQEKYEESVRAYKDALKINPKDEDAKYNLMMALSKLKKQNQDKDKNKDKNKDQQQNKNQQQQKQNQQQDQQNSQNQQQQNKQGKEEQQPQAQQGQMTDEQAQRLLDALESEEGKVQQKINQQQEKGKKVKVQKDW